MNSHESNTRVPFAACSAEGEELRFGICDSSSPEFREILALRAGVMRRARSAAPDPVDTYSEHYFARLAGQLVASLRVTRAAVGVLDCEQHYPDVLTQSWRHLLTSASSFVLDSHVPRELRIARRLIEFAWADQLPRGSRLDVINVHERAITYYRILGYELLADSFFVHPRLGTPSHVMLFPAAPCDRSPLGHLFASLTDPFRIDALDVRLEAWNRPANQPALVFGYDE